MVAEETGQIIAMDRWVLREGIRQLQEWDQLVPGLPPLRLSVNFSSKQVSQADLVKDIERVLADTGFSANRLSIEITESAVMENYLNTVEVLARIQSLGIEIQVDDFGMGYSSLGYLSRFPLNALKIDRSFINSLGNDATSLKIVQAIVMMTHGLGMEVVAEGVENDIQLNQLRALGCEFVQGYLISKPIDAAKTLDLIKKIFLEHHTSSPPWKLAEILQGMEESA